MKKVLSLALALGAVFALTACGSGDSASNDAEQLLSDVSGTYEELFTVINDPAYDQLWIDDCSAIVGDEAAAETADFLKSACAGTIYGPEAVAAYGDGSNGAQFDCFFINGLAQVIFDGTTISGTDSSGATLFSHEYKFAQEFSLGGLMDGYLYETDDEDAGEFKYFLLFPDTPATTYHIEFRYGSDIDALALYNDGPYAYWLAAGIPVDADQTMIENVIQLFCDENLAEMGEEEIQEAAKLA